MKRILSDRVSSIIQELLCDLEEYHGSARADLGRLWRAYLYPFRIRLAFALLFTGMWAVLPLGFPLTARFLADKVIAGGGPYTGDALAQHGHLLLIFVLTNVGIWTLFLFCQWIRSFLMLAIGQRMVFTMRRDLTVKLQTLHIGFFERTPPGRIVSRIMDDVDVVRHWVTGHSVNLIASIAKLILGTALVFYLNWRLALFVVVSLPVYAWTFAVLRPRIRRANISVRRLNSRIYARVTERIAGVQVVAAFAREKGESGTFAGMVFNYVRIGNRIVLYDQVLALAAGLITATVTGFILYLSAVAVKNGTMSLGDLIAFHASLANLFEPVNTLATMSTQFQALLVVLRRVFSLLDENLDVKPGKIRLEGMTGKIRFDHVNFAYPGQHDQALKDITFRAEPGERIALMGPSGAGKSTIFQLLLRFYDPQAGEVRVGGVNLVDADPCSVRRHVRIVQQEPVIFSGTIADSITYGSEDATPNQIMRAAQAAELHDFIMSLPVKYETEVGERGVSLSGGQKQRLALATALLTDPEVLLLDDTTSALDTQTETRIRTTLNKVLKGRTSLIITQRIATARDCDRVIVFEDGCITQCGFHEELATKNGFYRRICERQGWVKSSENEVQEEKQEPRAERDNVAAETA